MTDKFQNKYRIASARLQNWDYGWNASYFVTICTHDRKHFFGEIDDGKMFFSDMGIMAEKYWLEIPNHFPFVKLDVHVIMPNHVHGIIVIDKPHDGCGMDTDAGEINDDGTMVVETPKLGVSTTQTAAAALKWKPETLGVIINQYKRVCTINIRKTHVNFAWQSRFHDHIIRDMVEHQRIKQYIINNPKKWNDDKLYN